MNISKKVLVFLLIIAIVITIVACAAIFVPSVNTWFSTNFGSFGTGFIALLQMPFTFALDGGAQTIAIYGLGLAVLIGFAYWVWHWDIGYKFGGTAEQENKMTGYVAQREPEEPETIATTQGVNKQ